MAQWAVWLAAVCVFGCVRARPDLPVAPIAEALATQETAQRRCDDGRAGPDDACVDTPPNDPAEHAKSMAPHCSGLGPSASLTIRDQQDDGAAGREETRALMRWVAMIVRPCIHHEVAVSRVRFELDIAPNAGVRRFEILGRASIAELATCLETAQAAATAPPSGLWSVEIVLPWGCPTLGPGFRPERGDKLSQIDSRLATATREAAP